MTEVVRFSVSTPKILIKWSPGTLAGKSLEKAPLGPARSVPVTASPSVKVTRVAGAVKPLISRRATSLAMMTEKRIKKLEVVAKVRPTFLMIVPASSSVMATLTRKRSLAEGLVALKPSMVNSVPGRKVMPVILEVSPETEKTGVPPKAPTMVVAAVTLVKLGNWIWIQSVVLIIPAAEGREKLTEWATSGTLKVSSLMVSLTSSRAEDWAFIGRAKIKKKRQKARKMCSFGARAGNI